MIVFNAEELRTRLRVMPDEKLHQFGEAAWYMCTPEANLHKSSKLSASGESLDVEALRTQLRKITDG